MSFRRQERMMALGIRQVHPLLDRQATRRRHQALERARRVLSRFRNLGIEGYVVGSLASGRFMAHSDIDFLVTHCPRDIDRLLLEAEVEQLCGDMPYHLIFLDEIQDLYWRRKLLAERKTLEELEAGDAAGVV